MYFCNNQITNIFKQNLQSLSLLSLSGTGALQIKEPKAKHLARLHRSVTEMITIVCGSQGFSKGVHGGARSVS
jgi:hypothetical protein